MRYSNDPRPGPNGRLRRAGGPWEIDRLGAATVVFVGGPAAVSPSVSSRLEARGFAVIRMAGNDRYGTAEALSASTWNPGVGTALVAVGTNYPGALSGTSETEVSGGPVLLVRPESIPASTAAELMRLRPTTVIILGGASVVSVDVASQLTTFER